MSPIEPEARENIVVNDDMARTGAGANGFELSSPSPSVSQSPVTDRDQNTSSTKRRRSGRPGDSLERFRAVAPVREIPWYKGKELPLEKSLESPRVQTRGACLLATRGEIKDPPCTHCATGVGRFSKCIASDEYFHGACATCQLATRGNLCSLRKKETLRIKPERKSKQQESGALHSIPRNDKSLPIEPRIEPRRVVPQPEQTAPPSTYVAQYPIKKRKRESLQETTAWKPYVSPYLPSMPLNQIQTSQPDTPTLYSTPSTAYPSSAAQHEQSPLVNYIYQKENSQKGPKLTHFSIKPPPPKAMTLLINESTTRLDDTELARNGGREPTDSLSPSTQLLQSFPPEIEEKAEGQGFVAMNADSKKVGPVDTPLIDTLPRKKQKQIYSILGGLQSGIRSCRQQADSMQKQLDLLQTALGIDADDSDALGLD